MQIKGKYSWIKHLDFILLNLLALVIAFICAFLIRFGDLSFLFTSSWKSILAILCLINLVVTLLMNPYSGIFRRPYYEDLIKILLQTIYIFIIVSIFFYLLKIGANYSRVTLVVTFALYLILGWVFLVIRKHTLLAGKVQSFNNRLRKVFVVADFDNIEEVNHHIYASDIQEYEIAGYCFVRGGCPADHYEDKPVFYMDEFVDYVITNHIDDVFVGVEPSVISPDDYRKMVDNGVAVHMDIQSITGIQTDDQLVSRIGVYKTLRVGPYSFSGRQMVYQSIKRIVDIIFAVIGCIFLLPLMLIVKISYLVSGDRKSIFYTQKRIGQFGKPFQLIKFRSMIPNADEILKELLQEEQYREQWEANQKFDDDPRITKIGRFLRRTSLDEFPQFLNVLKGEMSIVGPRPLVEGELEDHDGLTLYNKVKPGITGWWGCNGRSDIDYRERLELEYYYVKNCSLYLDFLCICRTVLAVIRREGAQ